MPGTLNVGGHNIITHSGTSGAGTINLVDQAGNTILTDSGSGMSLSSNVIMPSGSALQIDQVRYQDHGYWNTTSFASVSNFQLQITPKKPLSKYLLKAIIYYHPNSHDAVVALNFGESINGANTPIAPNSTSSNVGTFAGYGGGGSWAGGSSGMDDWELKHASYEFLYEPNYNNTNPITFYILGKTNGPSFSGTLNYAIGNTTDARNIKVYSTLTVIEIAA